MYAESIARSGRSASPEPFAPSQAGISGKGAQSKGPQIFPLDNPSLYNIPQKQDSKSQITTSNSTPSKSLLREPENHEFIVKALIKNKYEMNIITFHSLKFLPSN